MRAFAFVLSFLAILSSCNSITEDPKKRRPDRPNIILIMADDHAYQAISAYDSSLLQTPNIDRLAEEGMIFQKAFVTNSICSPSRAVILTGKFSHLNSVRNNLDVFDSTQLTFPKILQKNGYETAVIGKWHLKSTPTGFDYWKVLRDQGEYYHPVFITPSGTVQEKGYVTDLITDDVIRFMDSIRDPGKPFMLMYHHKAPHRSWWPAMEDLDGLNEQVYPEPPSLFDDYLNRGIAARDAEMRIADHMGLSNDNKINPEIVSEMGLDEFYAWYENDYHAYYSRLSEEEKLSWERIYGPVNDDFRRNPPRGQALTRWKYQRYMQDYLATIKSVDRNLGRLLDYLDEKGLTENTIVIYTSDQGFYLGEHGWFDKRFMYEESFRTPLLVRYPGIIKPGTQNHRLVQNLDFAPTILQAAGIDIPSDMQGKSMLSLFEGKHEGWRDAIYYHYYEYPGIHAVKRHYGIRTEKYKLIHFYYDIDEWELYDLDKDPGEMNNVYHDPEYSEIVKTLHNRLEKLRLEYKEASDPEFVFLSNDQGDEK